MQKEEFDQQIEIIIDHLEDDVVAKRRVKTTWPWITYPLQKMTSDGARFPVIPTFSFRKRRGLQPSDSLVLWEVSCFLCLVPKLWDLVIRAPMRTSDWKGWLLEYLSYKCFQNIKRKRQDPKNPFKRNEIDSVPKLLEKCRRERGTYLLDIADVLWHDSEGQSLGSNIPLIDSGLLSLFLTMWTSIDMH